MVSYIKDVYDNFDINLGLNELTDTTGMIPAVAPFAIAASVGQYVSKGIVWLGRKVMDFSENRSNPIVKKVAAAAAYVFLGIGLLSLALSTFIKNITTGIIVGTFFGACIGPGGTILGLYAGAGAGAMSGMLNSVKVVRQAYNDIWKKSQKQDLVKQEIPKKPVNDNSRISSVEELLAT